MCFTLILWHGKPGMSWYTRPKSILSVAVGGTSKASRPFPCDPPIKTCLTPCMAMYCWVRVRVNRANSSKHLSQLFIALWVKLLHIKSFPNEIWITNIQVSKLFTNISIIVSHLYNTRGAEFSLHTGFAANISANYGGWGLSHLDYNQLYYTNDKLFLNFCIHNLITTNWNVKFR